MSFKILSVSPIAFQVLLLMLALLHLHCQLSESAEETKTSATLSTKTVTTSLGKRRLLVGPSPDPNLVFQSDRHLNGFNNRHTKHSSSSPLSQLTLPDEILKGSTKDGLLRGSIISHHQARPASPDVIPEDLLQKIVEEIVSRNKKVFQLPTRVTTTTRNHHHHSSNNHHHHSLYHHPSMVNDNHNNYHQREQSGEEDKRGLRHQRPAVKQKMEAQRSNPFLDSNPIPKPASNPEPLSSGLKDLAHFVLRQKSRQAVGLKTGHTKKSIDSRLTQTKASKSRRPNSKVRNAKKASKKGKPSINSSGPPTANTILSAYVSKTSQGGQFRQSEYSKGVSSVDKSDGQENVNNNNGLVTHIIIDGDMFKLHQPLPIEAFLEFNTFATPTDHHNGLTSEEDNHSGEARRLPSDLNIGDLLNSLPLVENFYKDGQNIGQQPVKAKK